MAAPAMGFSTRDEPQTREAGFALPAVIFVLTILSVMAVSSLIMVGDQRQASLGIREHTRAFYAAEAGLNVIVATWDSLQYDTLMAASGDSVTLGEVPLPTMQASYSAVMRRVDDGSAPLFAITTTGASDVGAAAGVQVLLRPTDSRPFDMALFGRDALTINGTGNIVGDVGSNGNVTMTVPTVSGDATAGGTVTPPGNVSGTVTDGATPITLPSVSCPTGAYGPPPTGGGTIVWNGATGDLTLSGVGAKNFAQGTYYFHDVIASGGPLQIPASDTVQIFISGSLSITGDGFDNLNFQAGTLHVWGCGPDVSPWAMSGIVDAWLTAYAPNHAIGLSGSGDWHGSIIGQSIAKSGNGGVNHDAALLDLYGSGVVSGSWVEVGR